MRVISNTAMSLDGRISTRDQGHVAIGSDEDLRRMSLIRTKADAVLVGGNTFRNWPIPLLPRLDHRSRDCVLEPILNVIVSRRMDFELTPRFLNETGIKPLFLTNSQVDLKHFSAEVAFCDGEITPEWIVKMLSERGVKTLLIEGGGELITQFVAAGLLHEMYVTICPLLIGGGETPLFLKGEGFDRDKAPRLKLLSQETVTDEVFLHYELAKKTHH